MNVDAGCLCGDRAWHTSDFGLTDSHAEKADAMICFKCWDMTWV